MFTIYLSVVLKERVHERVSTDKNILLHEQAAYGRGTKMEKNFLDVCW